MNRVHLTPDRSGRISGDSGASLVEHTLLLSLIALACLAGLSAFGSSTGDSVGDSASRIVTAQGGTYP